MKNILIAVVLSLVYVKSHSSDEIKTLEKEWEAFKLKYGKSFNNLEEEEEVRKSYFSKSLDMITYHNKLNEQGKNTYSMAINKFADMSEEEKAMYTGYKPTNKDRMQGGKETGFKFDLNAIVPNELDWRRRGAVTGVKDSGGNCNSGWAFSATGALEGQYFQKSGKLVDLSEQNLVDCCDEDDTTGCGGGDPMDAYSYVFFNDGIDNEDSYPYIGKEQVCKFSVKGNVTSIKFFVDFGIGDQREKLLKNAVALVGPISTNIYVDDTFFLYSSGVYYNEHCTRKGLRHSVVVVGYGTTTDKLPLDYWLVKNSWGNNWGDSGYVKMSRNRSNNCGIASHPSFPILY